MDGSMAMLRSVDGTRSAAVCGRRCRAALGVLASCLLMFVLCLSGTPAFADEESSDESSAEEEKTSTPTVSIEVAEEDADGALSWGDAADAQAGEWASWRSDGTLPSDWDDFDSYCYAFNLTPDAALDVDESTVAVEVLDAEGESLADLTDEAAVSYEDGLLVVSFEDLKAAISSSASLSGLGVLASDDDASDAFAVDSDCTVRVSYEARLLPESAQAGSDGAAETWVQLEYSDSTSDASSTGTSVEDSAELLTWELDLAKLAADTGEALAGAGFSIRNAEGLYVAADGTLSDEAVELACGEDGTLEIVGLDAGDYTVTEVAAPEGYAAVDDFTLTITSELEDEVELTASIEGEGMQVTGADADSGGVSVEIADEALAQGSEEESGVEEAAAALASDSGSGGDSGGSGSALSSALSQTGDVLGPLVGALLIVAAAALVVMALRRRRPTGD